MIKDKNEMPGERSIDLTGPQGNVFFLLGTAQKWGKQMGLDTDAIVKEMQSSDYDNAVNVFDKYFGSICTLYR